MTTNKKGIAFVGNILVDIVKNVDHYPLCGTLVNIRGLSMSVGGCVPNTAIDLTRIDRTLPVKAIGKVGTDENGRFVVSEMQKNGIDVTAVCYDKDTATGFTDVMSVPSGERTFFCKKADPQFAAVHDIVREANELAEGLVRPGVELWELDKAARDHIAKAGYGEYFTHRLGHFIGQTDHEKGDVSATSRIVAKPGMIFSIEPGIYLTDDTGVRIEDLVLVTEDGCEVLNHYPKALEIL